MHISKPVIFILALLSISKIVFGQTNPDRPLPSTANSTTVEDQQRNGQITYSKSFEERERDLRKLNSHGGTGILEKNRRVDLKIESIRANNLSVPSEYFDRYQTFLTDKKMQLARITVNKCNDGLTVSVQDIERCKDAPQIWGGGTYYSFRNSTNFNTEFGNWADIQANANNIIAGSRTVQGIISNVGSVDIDSINLKSPELEFLTSYSPKKQFAEVQQQKRLLESGIKANGFIYSTSAPVKLNSTYVLRSIAYRMKNNDKADKRISILVVIKIVGVEKDGSLVFLWKELDSEKSPSLKG